MEIALLANDALRIKGKQGSFVVNPSGKVSGVNAVLMLHGSSPDKNQIEEGVVIVRGPGEYEVAGVKMSGTRNGAEIVYSLAIDGIDILLGSGQTIEKNHAKFSEPHIVILLNGSVVDPSFITALAPNVVIFYGPQAEDSIKQLAKEGYTKETKYTTTVDKLPVEMESVLLQ